MPLLSICIPTYNQPDSVRRLLEAYSEQSDLSVEVIICDDSGNDDTWKVVEQFDGRFSIKYIRRSRGGLDSAVLELVEEATGDYVWWIGDDVILPGVVPRILGLLATNPDLSFVWLNSCDIDEPNSVVFSEADTAFFEDRNYLLRYDIGVLGFITATLFRRSVAKLHLESAKKHVGSSFACLYLILSVLSEPGGLAIVGQPCFASRSKPCGEVRWYDQFEVFGINLFKIASQFEHVFERKVLRRALASNMVQVMKAVAVERAMGLKTGFASPSVSIWPLWMHYFDYWKFWVYMPLLLLPRPILKFLYRFYKFIG